MAKENNVLWAGVVLAAMAVIGVLFSGFSAAHANPIDMNVVQSAAATTTLVYMTPGTATTTIAYDSFNGDSNGSDSAVLLTQFTASSTSSILGIRLEYSQGVTGVDCVASPTVCDWYADNLNALATTSSTNTITTSGTFSWTFASTSQAAAAVSATNNIGLKATIIPVPTRYVRAIYTITGANGAVWKSIVAKKQQP